VFTSRDPIGQRSETIRRANLSAIVRELHLHGAQSRSELGLRTGLTRSAIRGLIGELVAGGVAEEVRSGSAGTPRPAVAARHTADARPWPLPSRSTSTPSRPRSSDSAGRSRISCGSTARGHLSLDEIAGDLVDLSAPLLDPLRGDSALLGIGVAVAGVVRRSDGMVRQAPNLGWRDVALGSAPGRCAPHGAARLDRQRGRPRRPGRAPARSGDRHRRGRLRHR
jgi:hypothetical protein